MLAPLRTDSISWNRLRPFWKNSEAPGVLNTDQSARPESTEPARTPGWVAVSWPSTTLVQEKTNNAVVHRIALFLRMMFHACRTRLLICNIGLTPLEMSAVVSKAKNSELAEDTHRASDLHKLAEHLDLQAAIEPAAELGHPSAGLGC